VTNRVFLSLTIPAACVGGWYGGRVIDCVGAWVRGWVLIDCGQLDSCMHSLSTCAACCFISH
jgi:hypothetical protein